MDFQDFLQYVPNLIPVELPATLAHIKMAPKGRIEELKNFDLTTKTPRIAAVMMLFYPKNNQTHLVLIVRNAYNGVHSSQIAFPGGKYEISDVNFEETALRETEEEVGVSSEKVEIIKHFTPMYIPPSNFLVHPFLGVSLADIYFNPSEAEVAGMVELPLEIFLDDSNVVNVQMSTSYATDIEVPAFKFGEYIIWGATAMMMSELKEVIKKVLK